VRKLVFWLVCLVAIAAGYGFAQGRQAEPRILSGGDVGFRVEGTDFNGRPTGTWVVRWNGQWVELGMGMRPVPSK
jgi:hypothetical protein